MTEKPFLGKRYSLVSNYHDYLLEPVRAEARQRIMEEILEKAQKQEVSCLCGNPEKDVLLAQMDRWGLPCSSVICKICGIIRVNPRWDNSLYSDAYSDLFWRMQMGQTEIDENRFGLSVRRAGPYADYVLKNIDISGKKVLEIGCSYGAGLQVLKFSGATLIGYDYDERMLDAGRRFTGLDLRHGGTTEALKHGNHYDLIILRHVFEHMLQPNEELSRLRMLLCEGGLLFIEVPGTFQTGLELSDPMELFNIFHPYGYSLENLSCIMRTNGFRLLQGDEHVYSLWQQGPEETDVQWKNPQLVKRILRHLTSMERARRVAAFRAGMARIPEKILSYFR